MVMLFIWFDFKLSGDLIEFVSIVELLGEFGELRIVLMLG